MKRLKDFFRLLGVDARAGVGETHLPIGPAFGKSDGEGSTLFGGFYGADGVFGEVPENLFELVAIGQHPGFGLGKAALECDAGVLGGETVFEERECVLQQRNQIDALEAILLATGIGQKIGDDVVETIGLADHDLQEVALFGIQRGRVG